MPYLTCRNGEGKSREERVRKLILSPCKVYYEQYVHSQKSEAGLTKRRSGSGTQDILFLHTAGSDGRQYHGVRRIRRRPRVSGAELTGQVMNDPRMLGRDLRMTVFDLPSHGRSFPPASSVPGEHYNSEDRYIEIISALIKHLGLKKTIVGRTVVDPVPPLTPVRSAEHQWRVSSALLSLSAIMKLERSRRFPCRVASACSIPKDASVRR
jgi:hypothetical protein